MGGLLDESRKNLAKCSSQSKQLKFLSILIVILIFITLVIVISAYCFNHYKTTANDDERKRKENILKWMTFSVIGVAIVNFLVGAQTFFVSKNVSRCVVNSKFD